MEWKFLHKKFSLPKIMPISSLLSPFSTSPSSLHSPHSVSLVKMVLETLAEGLCSVKGVSLKGMGSEMEFGQIPRYRALCCTFQRELQRKGPWSKNPVQCGKITSLFHNTHSGWLGPWTGANKMGIRWLNEWPQRSEADVLRLLWMES